MTYMHMHESLGMCACMRQVSEETVIGTARGGCSACGDSSLPITHFFTFPFLGHFINNIIIIYPVLLRVCCASFVSQRS